MTIKKKFTAVIVLFFTFLHFHTALWAQTLPLVTGEWIPYTSASMEGYGEFSRLVTIILKRMNIEPNYSFYPWRRCFDSVENGRVWAAFPYSFTKERAEKVWFSDALSCSKTVFFYMERKDSPNHYSFSKLEDLKPYRIGGVRGYFYEETFKNAGLQVDYVNKEIQGLEKLRLGRIDLMPYNERVGKNLIKTHFPDDIDKFKVVEKPLSMSSLRLIVSKEYPGSKQLLERFNHELKKAKDAGIIGPTKCQ